MIVGSPSKFALESEITRVVRAEGGVWSSGFFAIHMAGFCYGVREPDATLLGCSVDEVERRIARRGTHVASFASESAATIADAYRDAIFAPDQEQKVFFGIPHAEFENLLYARHIGWAPDGDEAFDDGSYVLQFDVGEKVRVVAFRTGEAGYHHDPATLRDLWIDSNDFYGTLIAWRTAYADAWALAHRNHSAK